MICIMMLLIANILHTQQKQRQTATLQEEKEEEKKETVYMLFCSNPSIGLGLLEEKKNCIVLYCIERVRWQTSPKNVGIGR